MSFKWPWGKRPRVIRERAKRRRATQAEMSERLRAKLEKEKALLKAQIEQAKLRRELKGLEGDTGGRPIDVAELAALDKTLRPLGLAITPVGEGPAQGDGIRGYVRDFLNSQGGAALLAALGQSIAAQMQASQGGATPSLPGGAREVNTGAPSGSLPPVEAEEAPQPGPVLAMSPLSAAIVAKLEAWKATPEVAARWLLSQEAPQAKDLIVLLREQAEAELPAVLEQLAEKAPDLAGVALWLKGHWDWTVAVARAVRSSSMGF